MDPTIYIDKHDDKENSTIINSISTNKSTLRPNNRTNNFKVNVKEQINTTERIVNIVKQEFLKASIGGACLGNSTILSECLALKNIESRIVDGYSTLGGYYFNRHVWVEVNGKVFDCEPIKDMLEEKFNEKTMYYKNAPNTFPSFQGEILSGDTKEEVETYQKLEEAIEIYKKDREEGLKIIFSDKKIRKIRKSCLRKTCKI